VLAEVQECVTRHGIREIDFFDADLLFDRRRAAALCRGLAALGLDLEWSCRTSIRSLDREVLELAAASGCRQMYVGLETATVEAQRRMRKPVEPRIAAERLRWMQAAGIRPLGFFMLGVPTETHRSCLQTIRWALSLPLDYAQFSRMVPKPGSELDRELVARTGRDYWRDYVLGKDVPPRLDNIWSAISEDAIEHYTKLAYLLFYYRPGMIAHALGRLRSWDEAVRSGRTALRMLAGLLRRTDR
jgi:radical SAM superfamily enzyme YgiQ (UPF0313 family)